MRVLVTGANGFVGRALCGTLLDGGYEVVGTVRRAADLPTGSEVWITGDIGPETDWSLGLAGVDCLVHLAARGHVLADRAADPLAAFRRTNVAATLRLAEAAARAGLNRFVYLSSVKVLGEASHRGPLTDSTPVGPEDAYAISKWEAEQGLRQIAGATPMKLVILRPPLVYGPGVAGNFLSLLRVVERGIPLPLASVRNRRSLLYLGNLVDAIQLCLRHAAAPGRTFLLRDGEDLATPELIRRIARALDRRARLLPLPPAALWLGARAVGRGAEAARLIGSLVVDDGPIRRELGWRRPFTLDEGLRETAKWYRSAAPRA